MDRVLDLPESPLFITYALGTLMSVVILTLSLHLQWQTYQADIARAESSESRYDLVILEVQVIWFLCFIIVAVFRPLAQTTYYSYFLIEILMWPLMMIWGAALCLSMVFTKPVQVDAEHRWTIWFLRLGLILGLALFALACVDLPQTLTDYTHALLDGPQPASGVVEMSDSIGGRAPRYIAIISGRKYQIPDYTWWRTLEIGDAIQFIRDPAGLAAFPQGHVQVTRPGFVFMYLTAILWLGTVGFVVYRLRKRTTR